MTQLDPATLHGMPTPGAQSCRSWCNASSRFKSRLTARMQDPGLDQAREWGGAAALLELRAEADFYGLAGLVEKVDAVPYRVRPRGRGLLDACLQFSSQTRC